VARGQRPEAAVSYRAAVLVLAVAGGMRSSPAALGPLIFVVSLSARVSGVFLSLGTKAPFGYAFVAGMVASVNPCGFVLLPAYIAYYLGGDPAGGLGSRLYRLLLAHRDQAGLGVGTATARQGPAARRR
jgi:hypothetical protein